jgi:hypothetical protein
VSISIDESMIPGGSAGVPAGSRIDIISATPSGAPLVVPGLMVLKVEAPPKSGQGLGASAAARIELAVPDATTAQSIFLATSSGKFIIRVAPPSSGGP